MPEKRGACHGLAKRLPGACRETFARFHTTKIIKNNKNYHWQSLRRISIQSVTDRIEIVLTFCTCKKHIIPQCFFPSSSSSSSSSFVCRHRPSSSVVRRCCPTSVVVRLRLSSSKVAPRPVPRGALTWSKSLGRTWTKITFAISNEPPLKH